MNERVMMFGIGIDKLTMQQATARLLDWAARDEYACRYVVTPNVDHVVKLQTDAALRAAYASAAMVVVDGKPVLLASRLLGTPLPETVPGSDLCPALFEASRHRAPITVFLLGAADGVADRAGQAIEQRWPWVKVCGVFSPPMGFNAQATASATAIEMINMAKPDVLIIGLGAPKQELWVHAVAGKLHAKVALCAGATIDFLAGEKARAPVWMRRLGIEWLHRALTEPRRLLGRYLHDGWVFPRLMFKEWIKK
jgi:N-acetylglucosaminyldiphosphoundecaprenol N-acetyl-beta-D-mannosaminyltransferase